MLEQTGSVRKTSSCHTFTKQKNDHSARKKGVLQQHIANCYEAPPAHRHLATRWKQRNNEKGELTDGTLDTTKKRNGKPR